MGGPAGRGSSDSERTHPTRPSSAVVNVGAPIVEKTSFASLRKFDVVRSLAVALDRPLLIHFTDGKVSPSTYRPEQVA